MSLSQAGVCALSELQPYFSMILCARHFFPAFILAVGDAAVLSTRTESREPVISAFSDPFALASRHVKTRKVAGCLEY